MSQIVTTPQNGQAIALVDPADGVPPVIDTDEALATAVERLAAGTGPVAIDAERASGYRYGQRAYLIQLRRVGSGTLLIDPIPLTRLDAVQEVIGDAEWILHAAHQDLPCLAEIGLYPSRVFDTELAARLAGLERVGLASVVELLLGFTLEKGYSAADWSTRPLPQDWLRYAALDVELLIELRELLGAELDRQGKLGWAEQEFTAAVNAQPKTPPAEPWRRTSGIHRVRSRRQLAVVRALWIARDERARSRDIAPGRVLPDAAIVTAALTSPKTQEALAALPVYSGPRMRRTIDIWWKALSAAAALPDADLPGPPASTGLPPAGRWSDRDPAAALRLAATRAVLRALAASHNLPVENLLEPALQRKLAWSPPEPITAETIAATLAAGGARAWQVELTTDVLIDALNDPQPIVAAAEAAAAAEAEAAEVAAAQQLALEAESAVNETASAP
ncbi:MAG: putative ribonuclease match [Mycobacterium sp.]|nr:putative ribonuclease match [Mycobacterium sp.]